MNFLQNLVLKKICHFIFVVNCNVIFRFFQLLKSLGVALVFLCQNMTLSLQILPKDSMSKSEIRMTFEKKEVVLNVKSAKV